MLKSLKISGFRKYRELCLKDLGRVNCILGQNNVGKTTILEAIYTWACGQNLIPLFNMPMARGRYVGIQQPYWMMEELLSLFNDSRTLPLKMTLDGVSNGKRACFEHTVYPSDILTEYDSSYKRFPEGLMFRNNEILQRTSQAPAPAPVLLGTMQIVPDAFAKWEIAHDGSDAQVYEITTPILQTSRKRSFYHATFIDVLGQIAIAENVQIYSCLKRENLLDEVVKEMRHVFPEISGFDMIPYPDATQAPVSVVQDNGRMLPLYVYGDGVQRWFYIFGVVVLYKNSIICIDEIDVGFHPTAQVEFCTNLILAAKKNNVQLFLTTHNLEFIDNFLKATKNIDDKDASDIKIITLRRQESAEGPASRTLDALEAREARDEFALELR